MPFSSPVDLPDPGMEHASPALAGGFFTTAALGKPHLYLCLYLHLYINVTYYVPGSVLASGNETMNKTAKPLLISLPSYKRGGWSG